MFVNRKLTEIAHQLLLPYCEKAQVAVDLTAGNGQDVLFLRKHSRAFVYAFDIQTKALENTKSLLISEKCFQHLRLIEEDHQTVDLHVKENIDIACMNLGYLPGSDKQCITHTSNTIEAIRKTLLQMNKNSAFSIILYEAHEHGFYEKEAVFQFLKKQNPKKVLITRICHHNVTKAPELVFLEIR